MYVDWQLKDGIGEKGEKSYKKNIKHGKRENMYKSLTCAFIG
jgi:hypothetical protein